MMIGTSSLMSCCATTKGVITEEIPKMTKILKILLPTIFPIAKPASPDQIACKLTANSGALVP